MIRPKNPARDSNERAYQIGQLRTGEVEPPSSEKRKNPHAVALGKRGGLKGGRARADKLSAEQRRESGKKAAKARWSKSPSAVRT